MTKGTQLTKGMLKTFLKENKGNNDLLKIRCFNYVDNNRYWIKGDKMAVMTVANENYDFARNKVTISKLHKDGIYITF